MANTIDTACEGCNVEITVMASRAGADNYCGMCYDDGTAAADQSWKEAGY